MKKMCSELPRNDIDSAVEKLNDHPDKQKETKQ